jgi:uncharacterized membrane protein (DUF4010 family)
MTVESIVPFYETEYFRFILTLILSFLTGLEMRKYKRTLEHPYFIGTVRTYTFIGMLGYILYILDLTLRLYLSGLGILAIFFGLFYYTKLHKEQKGIISLLVALLVYTYAPMIMTQPLWLIALIFVVIIFVINSKSKVQILLEKVDKSELITFSKWVLLSAVIWPLLPVTPIASWLPMSMSKIWMAVVVVSGISYIGYLLQHYFFKEKGFLVSGILGGIYSSTATTVVLARKSKLIASDEYTFISAIILATGMMHVRLMVMIGFFNFTLFQSIALPMGLLASIALLGGYMLSKHKGSNLLGNENGTQININPLELGMALLVAIMFVVMTTATHYFIVHYGISGLNVLAFTSGFTDIDPFILSLINIQYSITPNTVMCAILISIGSNNILKGIIALVLSSRYVGWMSFGALGLMSIITFALAFAIR